ncbi:hypothetical protein [uncultured Sunxiuqinia sp.]|uniref:hypothetical protein n=1 Tax=uncultured Sunxiuqinia sp. TaxID=1573825 RepID=UPI002625F4E7|nr:hypothetical protein [uncultured Sunxiuqinia sp.]
MRTRLDLLVWRYLVPMLRPEMFQWKIFQLLAVGYSLCYSMPRRLMKHYFWGQGRPVTVDARELLKDNPHLLPLIQEQTQSKMEGKLTISQLLISDPQWKYSVGSFRLFFKRQAEGVQFQLRSNYEFQPKSARLTGHLHQALVSSAQTRGFLITSPPFWLSNTELEVQPAWSEIQPTLPLACYLLV